ncbi:mannitol-1-phosphate 5-dehydrogenase [Sporolactobacillus laevolacticus]|uniref:Mannitol-1-phosphate 5-dehydrogenase n=1 Tax=Sporolactobacillus laevolacticus DSM 442 TaxID=1395513 RepID=V6J3A3_9BACL|nr:mannitol-1-phosphate 5-dehydrogenase [Sporolactobacillus laevolacticus]EST11174.1 mannitol-1-phosphate 5-dehydrogenase [Sporolactobacillus laevolacticus DSM 442]
MNEVVHFGAGNIGRGFIGALFAETGYHVTFVDIAEPIIDALNEKKSYVVRTAAENQETIAIHNVSGINSKKNPEEVIDAIGKAVYVTTAIGPKVLPFIAPLIAKGIAERLKTSDQKLYVIACENQINATDLLKKEILKALDKSVVSQLDGRVYFLNSAVDRIVPLQHNDELLDVLVEDYHEWIVESDQQLPGVKGMQIVPDLAPYIERKLFTVNTGHATTAYLGYQAGKEKIHEALRDPEIYQDVKATIEETGAYLIKQYGFKPEVHEQYIEKILHRFQNPKLNDDVIRVGRSPLRKLGPEDRLVKPAREAEKLGLSFAHLAKVIAAALRFDVTEDAEAVKLQQQLKEKGVLAVLQNVSGLDADDPITQEAVHQYEQSHLLKK